MLQEIYVVVGIASILYMIMTKKTIPEVELAKLTRDVGTNTIQPPSIPSPPSTPSSMSVSSNDLFGDIDVYPLQLQEGYMDLG